MAPSPRKPRGRTVASAAGQTLPLVVVFMFSILVFAGLVIDFGNAYRVQKALQASADASAAAGAGQLTLTYPPITANAQAAATKYGSQSGGVNPITGVPSGNVTQTVTVSCAPQVGYNCTGGYANTVDVKETANVPTYLLKLLGFPTIKLNAHAQACSPCGGVPLDMMIVLDRTGSMGLNNKLTQAKAGINAFMKTMDPTLDYVGLAVLPPAPSVGQACTDVTSSFNGTKKYPDGSQQYNGNGGTYSGANPAYVLVPLSNTYATSVGNLNMGSTLMSTINCVQDGGGTAYAEAIDAAYAELQKDGRPGTQKVIVFLSDGAANDGPDHPRQHVAVPHEPVWPGRHERRHRPRRPRCSSTPSPTRLTGTSATRRSARRSAAPPSSGTGAASGAPPRRRRSPPRPRCRRSRARVPTTSTTCRIPRR